MDLDALIIAVLCLLDDTLRRMSARLRLGLCFYLTTVACWPAWCRGTHIANAPPVASARSSGAGISVDALDPVSSRATRFGLV